MSKTGLVFTDTGTIDPNLLRTIRIARSERKVPLEVQAFSTSEFPKTLHCGDRDYTRLPVELRLSDIQVWTGSDRRGIILDGATCNAVRSGKAEGRGVILGVQTLKGDPNGLVKIEPPGRCVLYQEKEAA